MWDHAPVSITFTTSHSAAAGWESSATVASAPGDLTLFDLSHLLPLLRWRQDPTHSHRGSHDVDTK